MSGASNQTAAALRIAEEAPKVDVGYAPNVIVALLRVMRDLPGIGKDQTAAAQQGGYAYRGIEQITQHTQGLFARHGVVFSPRVVHYEIREITVNNKPWTDTVELVEYDVYGPGGIEDRITVGPILAIGRDNSDKGANKCLTQAYKYALLQALSISDAKDDADGTTHEADSEPGPHPLRGRLAAIGDAGDRLWQEFLSRSAVAEDKADALLESDAAWRKWLEDGIAAHAADAGEAHQ